MGLTIRAMSAALGITYQTITRWENGSWPISNTNAGVLSELVAYTNAVVDALVEAAPATIIVYRDDKAFRANEDTGGWMLSAAWHRMVAVRAAERIPGARVDYRD
jgi:transcriptional regulator with XRE-family HTH domain